MTAPAAEVALVLDELEAELILSQRIQGVLNNEALVPKDIAVCFASFPGREETHC